MPVFTGNYPTLANNGRIVAIALSSITDAGSIYPKGETINTAAIGAAGAVSITVPGTELTGQLVQFRIERGTVAPYTLVDSFDRVVPNTAGTLASLIDSYYAPSLLDASNWAIAQLLSTNSTFLASVPGFNELTWTSAQTFKLGDYTWRGDGLYRWISATQGSNKDPLVVANVTPTVGAVWEKKSTLPTAAALSTNVRAYDQAIFEALTSEPASRKNLNELRSVIAAPNLSGYAQLAAAQSWTQKQTFGAGAAAATANPGTNNTDVATNAFVQAAIAGAPLPPPVGWIRRSTDFTLDASATAQGTELLGTLSYTDRPFTTNNLCNNVGDIVIPAGGGGLFLVMWGIDLELRSAFDGTAARVQWRAALNQFAPSSVEVGDISRKRVGTLGQGGVTDPTLIFADAMCCFKIMNLASGSSYNTRIGVTKNGTNSGSCVIKGNVFTTFLKLWRIAPIP
jgi:hypothetical protein